MEKLIYCEKSRIPTANMEDILDGEQIKIERKIYERISRRPNNRRPLRALLSEKLQQRIVIYG